MAAIALAAFLLIPGLSQAEDRSIDGMGNNVDNPAWGSAGSTLLRMADPAYGDGYQGMAGAGRLGAREVSNFVVAQSEDVPNSRRATDWVWQWGQFVDHDIDLTKTHDPSAYPGEIASIPTLLSDPWFLGTPIGFVRSLFGAGTSVPGNPRQQINAITAYIDGSNIYGSDPARAAALRAQGNKGTLVTSQWDLLPFNTFGLDNAQSGGADPEEFFIAGDVRVNEQVGLTATHTLFMREHNRLAKEIRREDPHLSGDEIYEEARRRVAAIIQVITYREFLPVILGPDGVGPYTGYSPGVNPGVSNEFSTASYRFGHSALSPQLLLLDRNGRVEGSLPLREAFFSPGTFIEVGLEPILRGLAAQLMQEVDTMVVDDVRNFLFGPPGSGGFDLASLNIQRGRDHGLPDYNSLRIAMGLDPITTFAEISSDSGVQAALASAYTSVDDIDAWVGGLAEDHLPGALVGELNHAIIKDQFTRLRDGDRFWYESVFTPAEVEKLNSETLSKVIKRNTRIRNELQRDVFRTRLRR
jgi:hypothetical protein